MKSVAPQGSPMALCVAIFNLHVNITLTIKIHFRCDVNFNTIHFETITDQQNIIHMV